MNPKGRPAGRVAAVALAAALAACGGGDGGADDGGAGDVAAPTAPAAPAAPATASRLATVSFDLDNNGTPDAVAYSAYDASGRDIQFRYVYAGDGTADRVTLLGTQNETDDRSYDSSGRLLTQAFQYADGSTVTATTSYDSAGLALSSSFDFMPSMGFGAVLASYAYAGGRLSSVATSSGGVEFVKEVISYNTAGLPDAKTETSTDPASGRASISKTEYLWSATGRLLEVRTDSDNNGSADERFVMSYDAAGLQTRAVYSSSFGPGFSADFSYDAQGRLSQALFDHNADGSVDAVATYRWEAGICAKAVLPGAVPLFDERTGYFYSAVGEVNSCAP